VFAIVLVLTSVATQVAQAQTFNVIYTFAGQNDGANPYAGVTIDRAGNLYGTTYAGGNAGNGTVFQLKRKGAGWILSPLYNFAGGNDGAQPRARVVIGPDGGLYGTTYTGAGTGCGGTGCGTVFNLRPPLSACIAAVCPWKETVLYQFTGGTDGGQPLGDLVFDQAGNIYGTTQQGGVPNTCAKLGCGVVYELTRSGGTWTESAIYQFAGGADGQVPNSGVVFDQSGDLFGTTVNGGSSNFGTVFELIPSQSGWTHKVIYNFQNLSDGKLPNSGVTFDASDNMYGTAVFGGTGNGGTVFELTPSGADWTANVVYGLTGGAGPFGNLSVDASGNLYGTTWEDGDYAVGSVIKLMPSNGSWIYESLHDFTGGNDGKLSLSNLVFDASGNMYGTAAYGGASGYGVVFEITP
jgi:uncharacterized repeat protein (TIGR03803 family)